MLVGNCRDAGIGRRFFQNVGESSILRGMRALRLRSHSMETLFLSLQYAFEELNLRKMFCGVYSNHVKSRFTLKKVGFMEEARLKGRFLFKSEPIDQVIYTTDRDQWKEIKKKFAIK